MRAKDINFDQFVRSVSNTSYHGMDLVLMVLSKMLKVIITFIAPDYIWMSTVDANVREASVVIVSDGQGHLHATGTRVSRY